MIWIFLRPRRLNFFSRHILEYQSTFCRKNHVQCFAEKLQRRGLIRISGESSSEFLQGLITNDMKYLENEQPSLYCMFLNNKGRVLFDSIIYRALENNTFYIECDDHCVPQLIRHLSLYKVRRKIDIVSVNSEFSVWAIYNVAHIDRLTSTVTNENNETDIVPFDPASIKNVGTIVVPDPRLTALGYRAIVKEGEDLSGFPKSNLYDVCRYKLGVGEGIDELLVGQSFPLEINCDYLKGVSFDKGCYIGQELTARTFHTGVIRKRLMPLVFEGEPKEIPLGTVIDDLEVTKKSEIGKLRAVKGNYGIGILRISEALSAKSLKILSYVARSYSPFWWPNSPQAKSISLNK